MTVSTLFTQQQFNNHDSQAAAYLSNICHDQINQDATQRRFTPASYRVEAHTCELLKPPSPLQLPKSTRPNQSAPFRSLPIKPANRIFCCHLVQKKAVGSFFTFRKSSAAIGTRRAGADEGKLVDEIAAPQTVFSSFLVPYFLLACREKGRLSGYRPVVAIGYQDGMLSWID